MPDTVLQSASIFDDPNTSRTGILPLQISPSDPMLPTLTTITGMLAPDQATDRRLEHLDPTLYDLRDESHLVRFLKALLGDSGVGQIRKRYLIARLQTVMASTHFYDLDGFYGALFGAGRRQSEQLPVNPMVSTATPDEWDDMTAADAAFRERVSALARALPMAGTVAGLQQAAEALTGVPCEVYESWRLIDNGVVNATGRTWGQVETDFPTWGQIEAAGLTWGTLRGAVTLGRSGVTSRDEVFIRPKTSYEPKDTTDAAVREAARQRQEDQISLTRALNALKPASVLLTVDEQGLALHVPTKIASLSADSEFWEVIRKVAPRPALATTNSATYPVSPVKTSLGLLATEIGTTTINPLPVPPFHSKTGDEWSYNGSITSVNGYAVHETGDTPSGAGTIADAKNWETILSQPTNKPVAFRPAAGISDQRALLGAQAASDSALTAHPYSGPRVRVPTHG